MSIDIELFNSWIGSRQTLAYRNASIFSDSDLRLVILGFGPRHAIHMAMPERAKQIKRNRNKDAGEQMVPEGFRWIFWNSSAAIPKLEEAKNEREENKKGQQAFAEREEARRREATQKACSASAISGIFDSEDNRALDLQLLTGVEN